MNELKGKYVNVVLGVEEGKGMEFAKRPLKITANFNGRVLDSDPADPDDCPIFNTELVWEVEKKVLRKIRASNASLRVECWCVDNQNEYKERVGYALLALRSAPPLVKGKGEIPFRWHKLMGVPHEHKANRPELYLSLTLRDHVPEISEADANFVASSAEDIDAHQSQRYTDDDEFEATSFPISYLEDGYIKVGKDDQRLERFRLYLVIKEAANLDVLLPEVLVFNGNREGKSCYHVSFSLFGITIKSKPFRKPIHDSVVMNEKIVVSLLSSFDTLKEFFTEHHKILVHFHSGKDKLGMAKVNVEYLMKQLGEEEWPSGEKLSLEERCDFRFPSPNGIVPESVNGRRPYIQVQTVLQRAKPPGGDQGSEKSTSELISRLERNRNNASGDTTSKLHLDVIQEVQLAKRTEKKAYSSLEVSSPTRKRSPVATTRSTDSVLKDIPYLSPSASEDDELPAPSNQEAEAPATPTHFHHFCLSIVLEKISLANPVNAKSLHAQFRHPKAATSVALKQEMANYTGDHVFLNDLKCKMFFISSPRKIRRLMYAWPPKLVITDEGGVVLSKIVRVRTGMLLNTENNEVRYTEKLSSATVEGKSFANVSISMYLQEYGIENVPRPSRYDLWPSVMDEGIVINAINDLERWKVEERQKFEQELEQTKAKHIEKINEEYERRRLELEERVERNVKKCKVLIQRLKMGANNLKLRQALSKKKRQQYSELEDRVSKGINQYTGLEYRELVTKICALEQENENLKDMAKEQQQKIESYEKSALSKEQTSTLLKELRVLEEQFLDAQKQKSYFKEQWKMAVQEIHELRSEDQKQLMERIQTEREVLSQLSLEEFYGGDEDSEGDVTPRNY